MPKKSPAACIDSFSPEAPSPMSLQFVSNAHGKLASALTRTMSLACFCGPFVQSLSDLWLNNAVWVRISNQLDVSKTHLIVVFYQPLSKCIPRTAGVSVSPPFRYLPTPG